MINVKHIVDGFTNVLFRSKDIELEAKRRLEICGNCDLSSDVVYDHCMVCKCWLPAKVRAMNDSCPRSKWGVYNEK